MDSPKERFPSKRKSKLMWRLDGPLEILEKIGPNAYKVDLPGEYGVSATFIVADLSPYYDENEELPSLRSNSNQTGGYDKNHPIEPYDLHPSSPQESIRRKEVKEVHGLVRDSLNQSKACPIWSKIGLVLSTFWG